jgi:hypothetical protein
LQEILLKGKKGQLLTKIWVNCAEKQAFPQNALIQTEKCLIGKQISLSTLFAVGIT